MKMKPVCIIGMGLSPEDLSAKHLQLIETADILVGGQRLLECFPDSRVHKRVLDKDITGAIEYIRQNMATHAIVVLASGDPLFFGIGARLVQALGDRQVAIYPNISSVAAAFARIKEPWNDVAVVSLHGRKNEHALYRRLEKEDVIAVFTDPKNNPAWLAGRLMENDFPTLKMCVLESLGTPAERFDWYDLERACKMTFAEPNLVILKRTDTAPPAQPPAFIGMPDSLFVHRKGLITKSEIRAVALAKLRLKPDHVVWDLGAGSGAMAIEASVLANQGRVYAVEKNPDRIRQIAANKKRFSAANVEIIQAVMPRGLEALARPDRIFIGGGGPDLLPIIRAAVARMKSDGVMVINTVLIQNADAALTTLKDLGLQTQIVQIQVSCGQSIPGGERLEARNPVWIITGIGKAEGGRGKIE
jgi:precorrin-6Y C5,15-methyltransferase (decarboxylating)